MFILLFRSGHFLNVTRLCYNKKEEIKIGKTKKLLFSLSSISFLSLTSASVVSCGNNINKHLTVEEDIVNRIKHHSSLNIDSNNINEKSVEKEISDYIYNLAQESNAKIKFKVVDIKLDLINLNVSFKLEDILINNISFENLSINYALIDNIFSETDFENFSARLSGSLTLDLNVELVKKYDKEYFDMNFLSDNLLWYGNNEIHNKSLEILSDIIGKNQNENILLENLKKIHFEFIDFKEQKLNVRVSYDNKFSQEMLIKTELLVYIDNDDPTSNSFESLLVNNSADNQKEIEDTLKKYMVNNLYFDNSLKIIAETIPGGGDLYYYKWDVSSFNMIDESTKEKLDNIMFVILDPAVNL